MVHALILDMIVVPEYQGCGIGMKILEMIVDKCKTHKIRDLQLFCAKGNQEFYERCGFDIRPVDAPGMEIKFKY